VVEWCLLPGCCFHGVDGCLILRCPTAVVTEYHFTGVRLWPQPSGIKFRIRCQASPPQKVGIGAHGLQLIHRLELGYRGTNGLLKHLRIHQKRLTGPPGSLSHPWTRWNPFPGSTGIRLLVDYMHSPPVPPPSTGANR
jgi:hypothetical protein